MAAFTRKDLSALLQKIENRETPYPVYLIYGDRFLGREAANHIVTHLLPDPKIQKQNLKTIDGDQEDPEQTLNLLRTYNLFPGIQIIRVMGSKLFFSKNVSKTLWSKAKEAYAAKDHKAAGKYLSQMLGVIDGSPEDLADLSGNKWKSIFGFAKPQENLAWVSDCLTESDNPGDSPPLHQKNNIEEKYISALESGIPATNILLLVAEAVDKRKKLYKFILDKGAVIDLSVDSGHSTGARKEQASLIKELIHKTLREFGKKIEPHGMDLLVERIGFHPVAAVMETEKLALYNDAEVVSSELVDIVIGRTREQAIFELTDAFAGQELGRTLLVLHRLQEQGIHPLAIVSSLRTLIRKLLLIRSIQLREFPAYSPQPYNAFQKGYLPRLKECYETWPDSLSGHPFSVYKMFCQAENFHIELLLTGLSDLLHAEYKIKSSSLPENLVIEFFLFSFFFFSASKNILS